MGRSPTARGQALLLGMLAAAGLVVVACPGARGAELDPLDAIARKFDDRRSQLGHDEAHARVPRAERASALERQRAELAQLLEAEAAELTAYGAGTASVASRALAARRAIDVRVEALGLAVGATDTGTIAWASSLAASLAAVPEAQARVAAIRLFQARARGQAAPYLDESIRSRKPELLSAHLGHVVLLVLESDDAAAPGDAASSDADERRALVQSLGARGLEVASAEGARQLGAAGTRLELVVDSLGHVRGVDLVGDERRALVLTLLQEAELPKQTEKP